jgi:IS605 OrfB family transposase
MHLTRTICCKLTMDDQDMTTLAAMARAFNEAATWVAQICWEEGLTNTNTAHHRVYGETRTQFGLGAQLAVCARMKAVEAIKAVKAKPQEIEIATCPQFGPRGSVRYDARSYTLMGQERVSLNTLAGRITCRLVLGERQLGLLRDPAWAIGGADLIWRRGVYYLHVSQGREVPDLTPTPPVGGVLGVDLGIVNLATDSEGQHFSGQQVQVVRARYHHRRQQLQQCGTRNAKRRIRQTGRREARFQRDVNHGISKQVVQKAVVARKALALEDLTGIRARTTVRRAHRYAWHSWAFFQLRTFISYKAAWAGVPVYLVDPKNTSRTCPRCGYCSKDNRKSQAVFACTNPSQPCGFTGHADHVGASNVAARAANTQLLRQWAAVNQPMASPREG